MIYDVKKCNANLKLARCEWLPKNSVWDADVLSINFVSIKVKFSSKKINQRDHWWFFCMTWLTRKNFFLHKIYQIFFVLPCSYWPLNKKCCTMGDMHIKKWSFDKHNQKRLYCSTFEKNALIYTKSTRSA